jgi:hypothetical protein
MIQWYRKIQYCFYFMFRPLHRQYGRQRNTVTGKQNVLLSGRLFWPLNREVHEVAFTKPSHNDSNAVCVARNSTSSYDEFNNGVTNVKQLFGRRYRGRNGELVWTAIHLAPGSQSVQYSYPRLKWIQCADYWWTFMNTVINLWGSKYILTYRSTTIFSRRNLFHEGGSTQRHSARCRVISQFLGSHWLTNLLTI